MQAVELLELIYKANPQLTTEWYRSLKGLRPNIAAELEEKLHINWSYYLFDTIICDSMSTEPNISELHQILTEQIRGFDDRMIQ